MQYVGRFAPSPTGPLHFGSLVAALGSYLLAKQGGGRWLVRMEDVDVPRNVPGAADDILRCLAGFGFEWDGDVLYQSHRTEAYHDALRVLRLNGQAYPCACTRSEVEAHGIVAVDGGWVYPGTCREGLPVGRMARAYRFRVPEGDAAFDDGLQGRVTQRLSGDVGDFVLQRADGLYSYQLAVVVDDAFQGVTHVVRGADLIDSTPRQIALQDALGVFPVDYLHLPVAVDAAGEKLSKQTLARALDVRQASEELVAALRFLGQDTPQDLAQQALSDVWRWARLNFSEQLLPRRSSKSVVSLR